MSLVCDDFDIFFDSIYHLQILSRSKFIEIAEVRMKLCLHVRHKLLEVGKSLDFSAHFYIPVLS